jgi:hypothetical protein
VLRLSDSMHGSPTGGGLGRRIADYIIAMIWVVDRTHVSG